MPGLAARDVDPLGVEVVACEEKRAVEQVVDGDDAGGEPRRAGEREERVDDARQPVDLRDDEVRRVTDRRAVGPLGLGEALRRGADDRQRIPHLVRDRGRELAERGELLLLREALARGGDLSHLRADDRRLRALVPARLDEPSETEAEHRERRAEVAAGEEGRVAAVDLEPEPRPVGEERVAGGERDAGREAPPAVEPEPSDRRVHARVAPGDCRAAPARHATRLWRRRHARGRAATRRARTPRALPDFRLARHLDR